jgi:hypothetical protein
MNSEHMHHLIIGSSIIKWILEGVSVQMSFFVQVLKQARLCSTRLARCADNPFYLQTVKPPDLTQRPELPMANRCLI